MFPIGDHYWVADKNTSGNVKGEKMRLIDLDRLMEFPIRLDHCDTEHGDMTFVYGIESVLEYAEYLPIIDAVPVVRCKDCKWFTGESHSCYSNGGTWFENEYCSAAERKEE